MGDKTGRVEATTGEELGWSMGIKDAFGVLCANNPFISLKNKLANIYIQFSSVTQSCQILCHSMPGLPVHHQFLEFTQIHVHWLGDAIQPSHPLLSPFPPAFNLSQHQGLFQWVSSSHQVAKVLEFSASASVLPMNTQDWSPLGWTGGIPLQSKGLSKVSPTYVLDISSFIWGCALRLASGEKKHIAWGAEWQSHHSWKQRLQSKGKESCPRFMAALSFLCCFQDARVYRWRKEKWEFMEKWDELNLFGEEMMSHLPWELTR